MGKVKSLIPFLLMYGGALVLLPVVGKAREATSNFALEAILFFVNYALWFYVIIIPLVIVFELWPKIKRRLFEKWKKEFDEEEKHEDE